LFCNLFIPEESKTVTGTTLVENFGFPAWISNSRHLKVGTLNLHIQMTFTGKSWTASAAAIAKSMQVD